MKRLAVSFVSSEQRGIFVARSGEISVEVISCRRHCKQLTGGMEIPCYLEFVLRQIANETLERTTSGQVSGLDPKDANKWLLLIGATTSTESNDQQQVSICLISIH